MNHFQYCHGYGGVFFSSIYTMKYIRFSDCKWTDGIVQSQHLAEDSEDKRSRCTVFVHDCGLKRQHQNSQMDFLLDQQHQTLGVDSLPQAEGCARAVVLPGPHLFQANKIEEGSMRPAVLHSYGSSKRDAPPKLQRLAKTRMGTPCLCHFWIAAAG